MTKSPINHCLLTVN